MRSPIALSCGLLATLFASSAAAENLIQRPGAHPKYIAELEPHMSVDTRFYGALGVGFRANFVVADRAFIPKLNDSVAVSVGLDLGYIDGCYHYDRRGYCYRNEFDFVLPVAAQWNFWFSRELSGFGELGVAVGNRTFGSPLTAVGAIGGRYLFNDYFGVSVRIGYPVISLGMSFLL